MSSLDLRGNNSSFFCSLKIFCRLMAVQVSRNSQWCKYGLSFSKSWNLVVGWTILDLISTWLVLSRTMMHDDCLVLSGCKYCRIEHPSPLWLLVLSVMMFEIHDMWRWRDGVTKRWWKKVSEGVLFNLYLQNFDAMFMHNKNK